MKMKKTMILSLLLLMGGLLPMMADNITVNGTNRSYNKIVPKNLGENRPLLIFCHGYNQDANWMQNNEFKNDNVSMEAVCDTAKFVVVFPNGIDRAWDTGGDRDINFIKAIIEKMVTDYKIDRNRIYMGGFSMGGMLTYNAINKMGDQIAAFVSCSGPSVVTPKAGLRPIPLLHIQGTDDNFSGAQPAVNVWIKHNGCPTTAKTVNNYNGFNCKMHTWGPGNDGVEVKLLELTGKGHWICKEPQVYTGKEIWNFCKKYSLNRTSPSVKFTSPATSGKFISFAPAGSAAFPDITITATADDPNGTIEKVEFYDGSTLLATCTSKPYQATLTGAKTGTHTLKAIATDNDGETSTATIEMTLQQVPTTLSLSSAFTEGNALPAGWTTYDSEERRTGYSNGHSQGCRVLQFTGSPRGFNYGLYLRNKNGQAHQGWAKYGLSDGGTTLSLAPGRYTLKYKVCNWNMANYGAVEVNIEKRANGASMASQTYTPNINIGNTASNSFGNPEQQTLEFEIAEQGDYVIAIYSAASSWSDCIVGQLSLTADSYSPTAIKAVRDLRDESGAIYDLQGRQITTLSKGIYIKNGKKFIR